MICTPFCGAVLGRLTAVRVSGLDGIEAMAKDANAIAVGRTEQELTEKLHDHLLNAGLPHRHLEGNRVVHHEDSGEFRAEPNEEAMKMSYEGSENSPPNAALTTFWSHVNVTKIHNQNLYQGCQDVGLV